MDKMQWAGLAVTFWLAGCAGIDDLVGAHADRDMTAAVVGGAAAPLASSRQGWRCGGVLGDTQAEMGGSRREPLQSSARQITDGWLRGFFTTSTFDRQMRQASMRHDFCYEHGQATYGKDRRACDSDFLADAQRLCALVNRSGWEWSCPMRASVAYVAVSLFGGMYSAVKGQSQCNYEQSLGPARDAVLSGRFRDPVRDEPLGIFATGQGMLRFVALDRPDDVFSLDPAALMFAPLGKSLGQMGLTGTDFLAYPPTAANVDARDGLDEIVLFALHRHDRQNLDRGGAGLVVLVVNPGQRRAWVFSGSPSMLTDFADPAARKANDALLPLAAESLFAPVLALPTEDGGERLLLFAPGTVREKKGAQGQDVDLFPY